MKNNNNFTHFSKAARPVLMFTAGLFMLVSCKKGEVETFDQPAPEAPSIMVADYVPVYPNTDAVLVSIRNVSFEIDGTGQVNEKTVGGAKAVFPDKQGGFINAGEVAVQNVPLNADNSNNYGYQETALVPEGIPFTNNKLRWSVSGNANIKPMNFINTDGFPQISPILDDPEIINRNSDFILGLTENIQNADSVHYTITSTNGYIFADDWAKNNSVTFTSSQLKTLSAGDGYIRITAFRTVTMQINEKMIQAINQSVITKKVTIL